MEALLRPPVELWSTCTAFAAGTLAWLAPGALMMPPGIALATGMTFFGIGLWRGRQAWRVLRYQRCLLYTSPSPRDLSTSRMPSSA